MKASTIVLLHIITLIYPSIQLQAATIYTWVDNNGKVHYSDKPSSQLASKKFDKKTLQKVKLAQVKTIKTTNRRSSKRQQSYRKTNGNCSNLRDDIKKLELKLQTKLPASKFDHYNQQLSDKKWQKIKRC